MTTDVILERATADFSLDDVKQLIEAREGVATTTMGLLRDAAGKSRNGKLVRESISKELKGRGLAHYPDPLPNYQHEIVRVYQQGSAVEDIILAVLNPSAESDAAIRKAAGGNAAEVLARVRELVGE